MNDLAKKYAAAYRHPAVTLLGELLDIPAPPGREDAMARFVSSKISALGFAPETDAAGNVLVRLTEGKTGDPVVLAAHLDEIALMVNRIEPDGRLMVTPSGGLMPHKIGERVMDIMGDDQIIKGVLSCGSGHVRVLNQVIQWSDCCVYTGFSEPQLRKLGIHEGATMVPERAGRGPLVMGGPDDPFLAAWTFDDRMGMVVLLRLLERIKNGLKLPDWPLILAFTVHEEGGCHGAKVLAHREQPAAFIAIDGCPIMSDARLKLDGRPGLWIKDRRTSYDHALNMALVKAADAAGVQLQRAVYSRPGSDASAVYDTGGAPAVAVMGHVRENSHGYEVARLSVFDNVLEVYAKFLETWKGPVK